MPAKKYFKKELGFTLIELLIVIAILSILIMLLFVSFTQVQKSSRDAQRKSDLQTVAGALQRFYSDNSHYPAADTGRIAYNADCSVSGTPAAETWGSGDIECSSTNYTKQLPKDPTGTNEYCYSATLAADGTYQNYILYARMEGAGNTSATTCNLVANYNYQVTPQD